MREKPEDTGSLVDTGRKDLTLPWATLKYICARSCSTCWVTTRKNLNPEFSSVYHRDLSSSRLQGSCATRRRLGPLAPTPKGRPAS
jgi:hypothetical protein